MHELSIIVSLSFTQVIPLANFKENC